MRILITGGSGMVGTRILPLLCADHQVAVYDLKQPQVEDVDFIQGDLLDTPALTRALEGTEAVVHLAAIPAPNGPPDGEIMRVNVMGSQSVFEASVAAGVKRVVAASTDSTFGFVFGRDMSELEFLPVDETHSCRPVDAYGLSKLLAEQIAERYTRRFGLETLMLRYCWVWNEETYAQWEALARDEYPSLGTLFGYIDARDVGQAIARSLTLDTIPGGHQRLLLAADDSYRPEPTLELIRRFFPELPRLNYPARYLLAQPHASLYDCTRARDLLGFKPEFSWRDIVGN